MKNEFNDFGVKSFSWKKLQALWANRFYINSLYLLISNVLGAVLGFVFWIIAAHLYTTEQVGLASAVISAIGLLAWLLVPKAAFYPAKPNLPGLFCHNDFVLCFVYDTGQPLYCQKKGRFRAYPERNI
jgi:hypothetical protein